MLRLLHRELAAAEDVAAPLLKKSSPRLAMLQAGQGQVLRKAFAECEVMPDIGPDAVEEPFGLLDALQHP